MGRPREAAERAEKVAQEHLETSKGLVVLLKESNQLAAAQAVEDAEFRESQQASIALHRETQRQDRIARDKKTDAQVRHA